MRKRLAEFDITSTALDFLGHGGSGGQMCDSSLSSRTDQALALVNSQDHKSPLAILGSSMGAYNAIKITQQIPVDLLILFVPGVYTPDAYRVPFGQAFSRIIRRDRSWSESDAWEIISEFSGSLLVVESENDTVIPRAIPQRLIASANRALRCEHLILPGASHLMSEHLSGNPGHFDTVVRRVLDMFGADRTTLNSGLDIFE